MKEFKDGDFVQHKISDRPMIVVCTTSDGMLDCRYADSNGIFQRQCFYPFELQELPTEVKAGFTGEEIK